MNRIALGTMLAALLLAIPLASAGSIDATVSTDNVVGCASRPIFVDTPFLEPYVSVLVQDCDATLKVRGHGPVVIECVTPPVVIGPFVWLSPYVRVVVDDCDANAIVVQ
jgi:hypothetical protein